MSVKPLSANLRCGQCQCPPKYHSVKDGAYRRAQGLLGVVYVPTSSPAHPFKLTQTDG